METFKKQNQRGRINDVKNNTDFDARSRLLRSQLRRQTVIEQLKMDRRMERKEQEIKREDRFQRPVQPFSFLPPVHSVAEIPTWTSGKTKSELVDLMMMQSVHLTQLMSQRMARSLVTPSDGGQSVATQRIHQRDRLLISLVLDALKERREAGNASREIAPQIQYLPVLQRLPILTSVKTQKEIKTVLESVASPTVSMTSRWKARAPAKQEPPLKVVADRRNTSILHRRKVLKKFRLAAYCALFMAIMKGKDGKRLMYVLRTPIINDDVVTGIRIKECVEALHKVYLNPERKMIKLMSRIYDSNLDLSVVLTESSSREQRHKATETIASFIEHVAYDMAFAPIATGNLGTENRSNLFHLLQPRQSFPAHYFWGVEKELLAVDGFNRTTETLGPNDEFIFFIGLTFGRALIATILRYPHQYGLTYSVQTEAQTTKVRLILTLFIYLIRKIYATPNGNPVAAAFPEDLNKKIFSDEAMAKLYKKLQPSFDYAEKLLRDWGQNYIRKLRRA